MLLIIIGLVLVAGIAVEIIDRHNEEAEKEFCELECRDYSRIYK